MVRQHKGVYQRGVRKGKLKPGFRYTGKRTKTGLSEIIYAKKPTSRKTTKASKNTTSNKAKKSSKTTKVNRKKVGRGKAERKRRNQEKGKQAATSTRARARVTRLATENTINGYVVPLHDRLGAGANGYVFLGTKGNKKYAVKRIKWSLSPLTKAPKIEQSILKHLKKNIGCEEYVICIEDAFVHDRFLYIVMEYIKDSRDLAYYIGENAKLKKQGMSHTVKYEIVINLIKALKGIHSTNIVHRDVKPANIMVYKKYGVTKVKFIDFGMACHNSKAFKDTKCWMSPSSPLYSSPELLKGDVKTFEDSKKSDIWSLGFTIFMLMTDDVDDPWGVDTYAQLMRKVGGIHNTMQLPVDFANTIYALSEQYSPAITKILFNLLNPIGAARNLDKALTQANEL